MNKKLKLEYGIYSAKAYWYDEEGIWIGKINYTKDPVFFQSFTKEGLQQAFEQAANIYFKQIK